MILNVLCFFNTKIECFTQPVFDDHDPKIAATQLGRSLKVEKDLTKVTPYKNLKLFYLGQFDDATGKLVVEDEPVLLLDCSEIVKERDDYVESEEVQR